MGRHEVDIHDELLLQARAILGTTTLRETVRIALERIVEDEQRRAFATRVALRKGLDAHDPRVIAHLAVDVDLPQRPG